MLFYFFTITTHSLLPPIGQPIFNGLGLKPSSLAEINIGKTPFIAFIFPSSPSSPIITKSFNFVETNCELETSKATAIGKSNTGPAFFTLAGAKLTVIL